MANADPTKKQQQARSSKCVREKNPNARIPFLFPPAPLPPSTMSSNGSGEWTPLQQPTGGVDGSGGDTTTAVVREMQQFASNLIGHENLSRASTVAQSRWGELRDQARTGDYSLRLLGLVAGAALVATSVLGFLPHLLFLQLGRAVTDVFLFGVGIAAVVLESRQVGLPDRLREGLYTYALFLKFVWGRGCLYAISGCLLMGQGHDLLRLVVGAFVLLVGGLYLFVGRQTAQKLQHLRGSLSEQTLRTKFQEANREGNGALTKDEFASLTASLGMALNRRELEAAFLHVSQDSGSIAFDRFRSWWAAPDEATPIV